MDLTWKRSAIKSKSTVVQWWNSTTIEKWYTSIEVSDSDTNDQTDIIHNIHNPAKSDIICTLIECIYIGILNKNKKKIELIAHLSQSQTKSKKEKKYNMKKAIQNDSKCINIKQDRIIRDWRYGNKLDWNMYGRFCVSIYQHTFTKFIFITSADRNRKIIPTYPTLKCDFSLRIKWIGCLINLMFQITRLWCWLKYYSHVLTDLSIGHLHFRCYMM